MLGDTVAFDVRTLIAQDEKTQFPIRELSTYFRISQASMEFLGLNLRAGRSVVGDTIIFNYESQRDLNDFVNMVGIHANLRNTTVYPQDLALFAPEAIQLGQAVRVNGIMDGRVRKFKVHDMALGIGATHLVGTLDMDGLPDFMETFIILNLQDSRLNFRDLAFLYNEKTLNRLEPMGALTMNGQFLGYRPILSPTETSPENSVAFVPTST
ncbi:MAG: hypothetical protein HC859_10785 [Bacteroidia bacterium]|nr:hypothetical protein [Bacteroidia bacterium]